MDILKEFDEEYPNGLYFPTFYMDEDNQCIEDVKQFISQAITKTREETIREVEENLPEFKSVIISSNGYFFNNRMVHIDEPKEDIAFNNCLVAVKEILNKLKK